MLLRQPLVFSRVPLVVRARLPLFLDWFVRSPGCLPGLALLRARRAEGFSTVGTVVGHPTTSVVTCCRLHGHGDPILGRKFDYSCLDTGGATQSLISSDRHSRVDNEV